jgi:hypothetical protein
MEITDMANIRNFATVNGQPVLLTNIDVRREGRYGYHIETKTWIKIERVVEYKSFASKHVCDDRCVNATGRIMKCECSCGGKNHGIGAFNCVAT